jgi:ornithine decarboxylase
MYGGQLVTGGVLVGTMAGKVAADVVFYAIAAVAHERRRGHRRGDPFSPDALDAAPYPTPFLLVDLDRVTGAYRAFGAALPVDAVHYPTACNADRRLLAALHHAGCRFTVASYPELAVLRRIGVHAADVLVGNPVKPAEHVARAHRAGCWRFAVDGRAELEKIAVHAPGAAVYVRLRCRSPTAPAGSGVEPHEAGTLLLAAAGLGLRPYGVAFHVGAQVPGPEAWSEAIDEVGELALWLAEVGIRLAMVDIGGGFPARTTTTTGQPPPAVYGEHIGRALDRLPYRPRVVASPGRAIVADAGVLVGTVLGRAHRRGRDWVHLDVGATAVPEPTLSVSDSRRDAPVPCHLAGPDADGRDTLVRDAALSATLTCGDRVYLRGAGAHASRLTGLAPPPVHCVGPSGYPVPPTTRALAFTRPYGS